MINPKYNIELWHKGQTRLADITSLCQGVGFTMTRNGIYALDFSLETIAFEQLADKLNVLPDNLLKPLVTDVKIKRDGEYLMGSVVIEDPPNFNQSNSTMQISCDGYLGLLSSRYVTPDPFYGVESTTISWELIDVAQNQTNGDMGITQGTMYTTGVSRDRTEYIDQNVAEGVVNLTKLVDGNFDFEIDPMRVYNTYSKIGSNRPNIVVNYPDLNYGIGARSMSFASTGEPLFNQIIALGSGFGDETIRYVANDNSSQITYGLRQKTITYNDISDVTTLAQHAEGDLRLSKQLLRIPTFTVGGDLLDAGVRLGDRITVVQSRYKKYLMDGLFRIEELSVSLDDNQSEDVRITVDNFGL